MKHSPSLNSSLALDQQMSEYTQLIQSVLEMTLSKGATAAEAEIQSGSGLSLSVRMGGLEKLEQERDKGLRLCVYINGRKGIANTSDFSSKSLAETAAAACAIARQASDDKYAGLADAHLMATELPDLALCHPWAIHPEEAMELAIQCEDHGLTYDKRINNSEGAMVSSYSGIYLYTNSHGFIGGWPWSNHMIHCGVIASDTQGMQCDAWYSKACDHRALADLRSIGQEAGRRATGKLGAKKIKTCQVPVIFEAPAASGLFATLIDAISGDSLYHRASFLLDQKGEQIFPEFIQIKEQPHLLKALGSAPFDGDGVATRPHTIVENGVLMDYVLSAYSARRLGLETTGNAGGVHNLVVETGTDDLCGLLRRMDRGLLITDLIGFGVNQVTGDYSRGASGFWVENGQPCFPVEEITVAGNLRAIYKDILAIGNDIDRRKNILTGSVLIEKMTVSGL